MHGPKGSNIPIIKIPPEGKKGKKNVPPAASRAPLIKLILISASLEQFPAAVAPFQRFQGAHHVPFKVRKALFAFVGYFAFKPGKPLL